MYIMKCGIIKIQVKFFFKTSDEGKIYTNGFYAIVFWMFIIPAIYYLIKIRKKNKKEEL